MNYVSFFLLCVILVATFMKYDRQIAALDARLTNIETAGMENLIKPVEK